MPARKTVLLGIDQGTTNTKAVLIDDNARLLSEAARPIAVTTPEPGTVEQDAGTMLANALACAREVLERAGRTAADVIAVGLSSQTETLVIWDRNTAEPVMPAMVWQCRRGNEEIAPLRAPETFALIRRRTGIELDPTFTAAKLAWLMARRADIAEGLRGGRLLWGTVDCWLRWKLSGGAYATEPGNASRTMLFDIRRLAWDEELLRLFGLTGIPLPEILPSAEHRTRMASSPLGAAVPLAAFLGDQQASLFGHGCLAAGETKITCGTGAFVWMNQGRRPPADVPPGIVSTIAWHAGEPAYATEGFVMVAGAALDWLAVCMGLDGGGSAVAALAERAGESGGVILVPAFQGLAGPWWQPDAKALLTGLTAATTHGNIAHAALESIALQIAILLEGMGKPRAVSIDGGVSRADYFLKLQANALGIPVARAAVEATSPYGAALMAGIGAGVWKTPAELRPLIAHSAPVSPTAEPAVTPVAHWRAWVDAAIAASKPSAA
jgi:glycerol kinase